MPEFSACISLTLHRCLLRRLQWLQQPRTIASARLLLLLHAHRPTELPCSRCPSIQLTQPYLPLLHPT